MFQRDKIVNIVVIESLRERLEESPPSREKEPNAREPHSSDGQIKMPYFKQRSIHLEDELNVE